METNRKFPKWNQKKAASISETVHFRPTPLYVARSAPSSCCLPSPARRAITLSGSRNSLHHRKAIKVCELSHSKALAWRFVSSPHEPLVAIPLELQKPFRMGIIRIHLRLAQSCHFQCLQYKCVPGKHTVVAEKGMATRGSCGLLTNLHANALL